MSTAANILSGQCVRPAAAGSCRQRARAAGITCGQASSLPSQRGFLAGSPVVPHPHAAGCRSGSSRGTIRRRFDARASAAASPLRPSPTERVAAFWKFLRPHTIRGTILGTTAVVIRALASSPELINWGLVPRAILGLLALLCGNGYIVGINQVYDVDIDKVNKPFLPVASGEMSMRFAWVACIGLAVLGGTIVSQNFGSLITSLYTFGLFLGTVYSVPPLRLKRFPLLAFSIIATVRGFLLNFGVYYATRAALGAPFQWDPPITFITAFVTVFAMVIAVTKDLPDVKGDQKFNIQTFATELGVQRIALFSIAVLLVNYGVAVYLGVTAPHVYRTAVMAGGHALLGAGLVWQAVHLHAAKYSSEAIVGFYRFIWTLFYLEYAMFPFI